MVSFALQLEAESAFWVVHVAIRKYRSVKDTSYNEAEDLHELETFSALNGNVDLVLANASYIAQSAPNQTSSYHYVYRKEASKTT